MFDLHNYDIISGKGWILAVNVHTWVLPGGIRTTDRKKAMRAAEDIDKIIRSGGIEK